ncbi:hypothetical protein AB1282_04690 [Gottfriedia sp. S16(2024)]|uniref:hypothetical protein n=1 Tax=Gottfriedia sp. S16(2024) TaxID=3162883 RepID=UPI003D24EF85
MKLNELNISIKEFEDLLFTYLHSIDTKMEVEEKNNKLFHYQFQPDGEKTVTIRVQETNNGLSISSSLGKNQEGGNKFLEWFNEQESATRKVKDSSASYLVDKHNIENIKEKLVSKIKENSFELEEVVDPQHCIYRWKVKHPSRQEKITVSQYSTGILLLQGKTWNVWDMLCGEIERELNVSVKEIVIRIASTADESVQSVVTDNAVSNATKNVSSRLGKAYEFLYERDQKSMASSQFFLDTTPELPEYFSYVAPALRSLEGYLKKIIIDKEICTKQEVKHSDFRFHEKVFNTNQRVTLQPKALAKLGRNPKVHTLLIGMYDILQKVRNKHFHGGPDQLEILDIRTAVKIVEDIYRHVSESYELLF